MTRRPAPWPSATIAWGDNLLDFSLYCRSLPRSCSVAAAGAGISAEPLSTSHRRQCGRRQSGFARLPGAPCWPLRLGLLIYDRDAGFRRFLGADPDNARRLRQFCDVHESLDDSQVMQPAVEALGAQLGGAARPGNKRSWRCGIDVARSSALQAEAHRYHPQMVDWVADQISRLIHEDQSVPPDEIVVLAPFLSDVLRFRLDGKLGKARYSRRARTGHRGRCATSAPRARC